MPTLRTVKSRASLSDNFFRNCDTDVRYHEMHAQHFSLHFPLHFPQGIWQALSLFITWYLWENWKLAWWSPQIRRGNPTNQNVPKHTTTNKNIPNAQLLTRTYQHIPKRTRTYPTDNHAPKRTRCTTTYQNVPNVPVENFVHCSSYLRISTLRYSEHFSTFYIQG
jgi:hypothetical protein